MNFKLYPRRIKKNGAAATGTVEFIFLILIIIGLILLLIDTGIYFQHKSEILNATQGGARYVAFVGGNKKSNIENKNNEECQFLKRAYVYSRDKSSYVYEYSDGFGNCVIADALYISRISDKVKITDISCSPDVAKEGVYDSVRDARATCSVTWEYNGLSFIKHLVTTTAASVEIETYTKEHLIN